MLTPPATFGTSRNFRHITIHLRWSGPEKLNHRRNGRKLNSRVENSILCPNGRKSIVYPHGPISNLQLPQLLNIMVGAQLNLFSKSSKFSAHLFWAWRHPHSCPIFCMVFIMTMVIVLSFAHERKLHQLTTHLNSQPE